MWWEVIHGANNQRIRDYGHDKLKVYGMGRCKFTLKIDSERDPPADSYLGLVTRKILPSILPHNR